MIPHYRQELEAAAAAHAIDPNVLEGLVEQESGGWASAFRHEPAFWDRYLKNNPAYSRRNPREVASSYGLCQVMYSTAVEHGFAGKPWELFDPVVGLEWGARVLERLIAWANGLYTGDESERAGVVLRAALAAYNGGRVGNSPAGPLRNRAYADQVLNRIRRIREERSKP